MSVPQIANELGGNYYLYRQPNLTYKLNETSVIGKIDGVESIRQSIRHALSTERYSEPIYDSNYGVELEQYVGKDLGFIKAGIEETLREALLQDDRITDVNVISIKESTEQLNSCIVEFSVNTIYGTLEETLNVLQ